MTLFKPHIKGVVHVGLGDMVQVIISILKDRF